MASMSFSTCNPDLRLGFFLVVAALLLDAGISGTFRALYAPDRLDLSDLQYGLFTAAFGLGSLFVVAAASGWTAQPHG